MISAVWALTCNVNETFADAVLAGSNSKSVIHNFLNSGGTINAGSTPPGTTVVVGSLNMTDGAATLDLRDLTGTNGGPKDLNGLKVQIIIVRAKATNANLVTLAEGESNGYELKGDGWTEDLQPGQISFLFGNDATPDVGAAAKEIDISGSGTQGIDYLIVAG